MYKCMYVCRDNEEHIDPHSYSWCMMRLAMVKHVLQSMNSFLSLIGSEPAGESPNFTVTIILSYDRNLFPENPLTAQPFERSQE